MKYFVMINTESQDPMPLMDREYNVRLFDDPEHAEKEGNKNGLGLEYGFKVYKWEY